MIRDKRVQQTFELDKIFIDDYGRIFTPTGVAVYTAMCAHTSRTGQCEINAEGIAFLLEMKPRTVQKWQKELEKYHIIERVNERLVGDVEKTIVHTLCDKSEWDSAPKTGEKPKMQEPKKKKAKTGYVEQHPTLVPEVIKAFEAVNSSAKTYYGHKGQRAAADRLIITHGFERVLQLISILPKTNKINYLPDIRTPYILEQKWETLEDALIKYKNAKKGKGIRSIGSDEVFN